jgi:hypothetical protein
MWPSLDTLAIDGGVSTGTIGRGACGPATSALAGTMGAVGARATHATSATATSEAAADIA